MNGVDPRGFSWTLAAAERLRQQEVDRAGARLAQAMQARCELQAQLGALESARNEQLKFMARGAPSSVDPARQQQALRYLAQSLGQEKQRQEQEAQLLGRMELARQASVDAQCRLESLRKLRATALERYTQDQRRRQAREADLAWLTRRTEARE